MSDDQFDRTVRQADPYRPGLPLDGASHDLFEEIVHSRPVRRRHLALAAAFLMIAVVVASTAFRHRGTDGDPVLNGLGYPVAVQRVAERNARLLIGEPGWTVTTVGGFADASGSVTFQNGDRLIEMNWYPADQYGSYWTDRLDVGKPSPVHAAGEQGALFRYDPTHFSVMLKPHGDTFVELSTGGPWTRATFDRLLGVVQHVDSRTWLAAMPAEIVTPGRADLRAAQMLAGVPLPPGFDTGALSGLGVNDPTQFGIQVASRVGCGWIAEWLRARQAADPAAMRRAADALRGSHQWKILTDLKSGSGFPDVFWQVADQVAAGHVPDGYQSSIGCG